MKVYKGGKTSEGKIFLLHSSIKLNIEDNILQFVPKAARAAI